MRKLSLLICIINFSLISNAKVSSDDILKLVTKLKGGTYYGKYNGQECSVSVVDNGGDGSAYSVRVLPTLGKENFFADFVVTKDQEGQVSDYSADSIGTNFIQSLTLVSKPSGVLFVRVSNRINGESVRGYCEISMP